MNNYLETAAGDEAFPLYAVKYLLCAFAHSLLFKPSCQNSCWEKSWSLQIEIALPVGRKRILEGPPLILLHIVRRHFCIPASCCGDWIGNTCKYSACVRHAEVFLQCGSSSPWFFLFWLWATVCSLICRLCGFVPQTRAQLIFKELSTSDWETPCVTAMRPSSEMPFAYFLALFLLLHLPQALSSHLENGGNEAFFMWGYTRDTRVGRRMVWDLTGWVKNGCA